MNLNNVCTLAQWTAIDLTFCPEVVIDMLAIFTEEVQCFGVI